MRELLQWGIEYVILERIITAPYNLLFRQDCFDKDGVIFQNNEFLRKRNIPNRHSYNFYYIAILKHFALPIVLLCQYLVCFKVHIHAYMVMHIGFSFRQ